MPESPIQQYVVSRAYTTKHGVLLDTGMAKQLVLAADRFIIGADRARCRERRVPEQPAAMCVPSLPVITGLPIGRDTMISLEGLTLTTGREIEAGQYLRTFAHHLLGEGLIPSINPGR